MKFRSVLQSIAVAAVIAAGGVTASASPMSVFKQETSVFGGNGYEKVQITEATVRRRGVTVLAGGFNLKSPEMGNFVAWCVDIATNLVLPAKYTATDKPTVHSPLSGTQVANILKLFQTGFSSLDLSLKAHSAGFQLAIWEVIYEKSGVFDLGTGNFKAKSGNSAMIAKAQSLLAGLTGPITKHYKLTFLESTPGKKKHYSQNLVTASISPVPLPAAGFLLLGALAGMGLVARRRRAKQL